ncbi:WYL domain-containing protein [Nonomuraea sp. NPDC050556]|uniref:WYL domain-containing protein n=1 Tax=Nonomuraea sp. NPDC050556 TaxID=3364369 RepID=UPI00378DBBFA
MVGVFQSSASPASGIRLLRDGGPLGTASAQPNLCPIATPALAAACVAREKTRFAYTGRRLTEPHQLVIAGRRWYLLAYDLERDDWRGFRLDRITDVHRTGQRFTARDLDAAAQLVDSLAAVRGATIRAEVLLHVPIDQARIPASHGTLTPVDQHSCRLTTSPDSPRYLDHRLSQLRVPYTLLGPPEVADRLRELGRRALDAVTQAPERPPAPRSPRRPG